MRVEACCQALLKHMLPELDPHRNGLCFDVGVGTFAFYCELFAQQGFATFAVEPLPTQKLRYVCQQHSIRLIEACLSDRVGIQTLHMGQFAGVANTNFSSLSPDWFGASAITRQVETLDLTSLLHNVGADQITCLKLDIEGWEPIVIQQLLDLPEALLPSLVMFEYGGGSSRRHGQKGWSPKFLEGTMSCLQTLQQLGYGCSIMIDYAAGAEANVFDLHSQDLNGKTPFDANSVYGNILSFHKHSYAEGVVKKICSAYRGGLVNWLINQLVA